MTWDLKNDMYNRHVHRRTLSVDMSFRTRDPDGGVLLHLPSNSHEYITLEVILLCHEYITLEVILLCHEYITLEVKI